MLSQAVLIALFAASAANAAAIPAKRETWGEWGSAIGNVCFISYIYSPTNVGANSTIPASMALLITYQVSLTTSALLNPRPGVSGVPPSGMLCYLSPAFLGSHNTQVTTTPTSTASAPLNPKPGPSGVLPSG
jgi:hypothetical protein